MFLHTISRLCDLILTQNTEKQNLLLMFISATQQSFQSKTTEIKADRDRPDDRIDERDVSGRRPKRRGAHKRHVTLNIRLSPDNQRLLPDGGLIRNGRPGESRQSQGCMTEQLVHTNDPRFTLCPPPIRKTPALALHLRSYA